MLIDLFVAIEHGPLRLFDSQRQGQAHLRQALSGKQRFDAIAGIEVDTYVARQLIQPTLPATISLSAISTGSRLEFRSQAVELVGLTTQRAKLEKQPGTVQLRQTAQRFKPFEQLLPRCVSAGIVLLTQDQVRLGEQRFGAVHVLHRRQTQHRHAQQMLGLGKPPLLAASPENLFDTPRQPLLITLQLGKQTATILQLFG